MAPPGVMAKKLYYKIGEACKLLDIQPYVLRYWETEFAALNPTKSKSGQRVYGRRDLAVIRRIKELLYDEGYTIAGAKKKLEGEEVEELDLGDLEAPAKASEAKPPAPPPKPKPGPKAKSKAAGTAARTSRESSQDGVAGGLRKALEEVRELQALLDRIG